MKKSLAITVLIAGMLFLAGNAAASGIQVALGDEVKLAGYATSGPYVYLFLTGPNLPVNGVALHDISKRADQGGFTKVSVDGDDRWAYTWHTGSIGGRLDEGTYTVWVVTGPNDRSRLAWADYRTLSVTLGKPFVSVDTPVQPGGMNLQSVPDGASLMVNGEYRGKTPLTVSGLSPGNYAVTFSRFGFGELSVQVPVEQGRMSEVTATLQPKTGTLAVNSTPPGARVLLDGAAAGLSPVVLENITADNHTVMLEKDGYITAARQVTIAVGQVSAVEVFLDPVPVSTTRADGLAPAMAGAFCVVLLGIAYGRCRTR
ncbi:MAG: PEGA domain-containing protein [Methanoregula sp.]|nr:PEGA domain-containing protein [Methanoregula sp.]